MVSKWYEDYLKTSGSMSQYPGIKFLSIIGRTYFKYMVR